MEDGTITTLTPPPNIIKDECAEYAPGGALSPFNSDNYNLVTNLPTPTMLIRRNSSRRLESKSFDGYIFGTPEIELLLITKLLIVKVEVVAKTIIIIQMRW